MHPVLENQLNQSGLEIKEVLRDERLSQLIEAVERHYIEADETIEKLQSMARNNSKETLLFFNAMEQKNNSLLLSKEVNLKKLAYTDALTKIPNRHAIYKIIFDRIKSTEAFTIVYLDIDNFKVINDTFGHNIGDKVLIEAVERLKMFTQEGDVVGRIGGDEFVVLLKETDDTQIENFLKRTMSQIRRPCLIQDYMFSITASVGIAKFPDHGTNVIDLMKYADIAMYRSKNKGKNQYCYFDDEMGRDVEEKGVLQQQMRQALVDNEFNIYFQPIIDTENEEIIAAEVLLRWHHPQKGVIMPSTFIPLSEASGFIVQLGSFVLRSAIETLQVLNQVLYPKKITVTINISPQQLRTGNLHLTLKSLLSLYNRVEPSQIALEITENSFVNDSQEIIEWLDEIKKLGVKLYMDDFGTGYSSLSYLHRLPVDTIKIDKQFIEKISPNGRKNDLLNAIIAMGATLNKDLIAEGVEKDCQIEYLKSQGVKAYQGYVFCEPLPKNEFIDLMQESVAG